MSGRAEPLWVVVGTTASGKTELAITLAEALGGEVINADSVQVYEHFNIGSGKPGPEELARAPHHLLGYRDPHQPLDAASWARDAEVAIEAIRARGKLPILCGGSFLFIKALLYGLAEAPPADAQLREQHRAFAEEHGRAALYQRLLEVDPARASELHPEDLVRVSRALEIFELSGAPMSRWQAQHGFREQRYPAQLIGVEREREELDARIAARIAHMLEAGWVREVAWLLEHGYGGTRAMGAVGYRQLAGHLSAEPVGDARSGTARPGDARSGEPSVVSSTNLEERANLSAEALAELTETVYRATRVFARRQRTWLRDQAVTWLKPGDLPPGA